MTRYDPKQAQNSFELPVCSSRSSFFKMAASNLLVLDVMVLMFCFCHLKVMALTIYIAFNYLIKIYL